MAEILSAEDIKRAAMIYTEMAVLDFPELREKVAAVLMQPDSIEIDLSSYPEDTADLLTTIIWAKSSGIQG